MEDPLIKLKLKKLKLQQKPEQEETQQTAHKEQWRKPPSGWRYYSYTPGYCKDVSPPLPDHRRWPSTARKLLVAGAYAIAIAILAILSFSFIAYYFRLRAWSAGSVRYGESSVLLVFGVCLALSAAVVVITASRSRRGRLWEWLGFGKTGKIPSRSRRRRLWEWLGFGKTGKKTGLDFFQFFVALSIPFAVLYVGGYLTASQGQDTALQSYLDSMDKLVIDNDLANSKEGDEVRMLALARTSTLLGRLGPEHKRSVLWFLRSSDLIDAKTPVIKLTNADLRDAALNGAALNSTYLSKANLATAHLRKAQLSEAVLRGTHLEMADMRGADLSDADLSDAYLNKADLRNTDLSVAATLSRADLRQAYLSMATLTDVDLSEAKVLEADLSDADLSGAHLNKANLWGADLRGADLTGADLSEAALYVADLSGADLTNANLRDAKNFPHVWKDAKSLEGATMPDGTVHD